MNIIGNVISICQHRLGETATAITDTKLDICKDIMKKNKENSNNNVDSDDSNSDEDSESQNDKPKSSYQNF